MSKTRWSKLTFEWRLLIGAFILTSLFLFIFSILLFIKAQGCVGESCMLEALTSFSYAAFTLLAINVIIIVIFLVSFFHKVKRRKS